MGQSTVLRFREKPKKVILGNSNYYHVEFVDNDLTIQPQGEVPTNMFVYGEYHTFGFNLKISSGRFDDLVNVKWKSPKLKKRAKKKKLKKSIKKVKKFFSLGKSITFNIEQIQQNPRLKSTIIDLTVENKTKYRLDTKKIKLSLTRSNKPLSGQSFVFLDEEVKPFKKTKLRFFITPIQKRGFSLKTSLEDDSSKFIVSRKFL